MATDPKRKNLFLQGHGEFGRRHQIQSSEVSWWKGNKRMENWEVEDGNFGRISFN